jgi:hypothetical protein
LGSTLSLLAHLIAGPKIKLKGPNFGPKIGSTLSLSAQITAKQKFRLKIAQLWARPNIEPSYLKYRLHEFIVKFNIKFIKGSCHVFGEGKYSGF